MMDKKSTELKQRKTCFRCKKKRYIDRLTVVFQHPVLSPFPILACSPHLYRGGGCVDETIRDLMLYANTGKLSLTPAIVAPVKPIVEGKKVSKILDTLRTNIKTAKKK